MRVGIIGTGAISHKHARAYANIGYEVVACTDFHADSARAFAERYGCEFVPNYEELCRHPRVDYVDVCTFPEFRLEPVAVLRGSQETYPGAKADGHQSGHRAKHDRDRHAAPASNWAW